MDSDRMHRALELVAKRLRDDAVRDYFDNLPIYIEETALTPARLIMPRRHANTANPKASATR